MKLLFKLLIFLLPIAVFSQEIPKAEITQDMHIIIDSKHAIASVYTADISCFAFASDEHLERFFNFFTTNLVSYKSDFAHGKVVIILHQEYLYERWEVMEWQKYLDEKYAYDRNNVKLLINN